MNKFIFISTLLFSLSSFAGGSDDNMILFKINDMMEMSGLNNGKPVQPFSWKNGGDFDGHIVNGGSDGAPKPPIIPPVIPPGTAFGYIMKGGSDDDQLMMSTTDQAVEISSIQFVKEENGLVYFKINGSETVMVIESASVATIPGLAQALKNSSLLMDWNELTHDFNKAF